MRNVDGALKSYIQQVYTTPHFETIPIITWIFYIWQCYKYSTFSLAF